MKNGVYYLWEPTVFIYFRRLPGYDYVTILDKPLLHSNQKNHNISVTGVI